jgi:hypothetical protein
MTNAKLIGWAIIIYAFLLSKMGWDIFVFLAYIRIYTGDQWWASAYASIFPISYFIGGVGVLLRKEWARWLVLATAFISLIFYTMWNRSKASLFWINATMTIIPSLLILLASLSLKFAPSTPSISGEKKRQETEVHEEVAVVVGDRFAQQRYANLVFWSIITVGMILPWAICVVVGAMPVSYFLNTEQPLSILLSLFITVFLASPFLILALLGRSWLSGETGKAEPSSFNRRLRIILGGFIGTVILAISTYVGFWRDFGTVFFFTTSPLYPLSGTGLGLLAGWLLSWSSDVFHRK